MGVLKLFEGTGDLFCAIATIKTSEGSMQKVVDGTAFSVGRAPDCVLSIPDVGISRLHLLVSVKRGEVYVSDQGSSNGTFINGEKIESKRLIHVKPSDDIKLGKSDVVLQFACLEKHFKTDYIAESLLPIDEKNQLQSLIKASQHKAQEIVAMAQSQAEQLGKVASEKARNTENQTLLMQEEILSKAQVEGQQIISDTKRKTSQMIFEAEESARQATENIRRDAENKRHEAETYYQSKIKDAQVHGDQIIAKHTQMGQQMIEELRRKTIEKAEADAKLQLSGLFQSLDEKTIELEEIKKNCQLFEAQHKSALEQELAKTRQDFLTQFDLEKNQSIAELNEKLIQIEADYNKKKKEHEENEAKQIEDIQLRAKNLDSELKAAHEDLQQALNQDYEKNKSELATLLEKQKSNLESEVESQRQSLQKIQKEIEDYSEKHKDIKTKYESLNQTVTGLQSSETRLIEDIAVKRKEFETLNNKQNDLNEVIQGLEVKHQEITKAITNAKVKFEEDFLAHRKALDEEMQRVRFESKKKSSEYEELEKIKLEEYKLKVLAEKRQIEMNFERLKSDYEQKTKEAIDHERKKLEDSKHQFLALMNNQRAVVTNELTKAIIKIEKRGDQNHSSELISHAVTQVFDSHVAEFSLNTNSQGSLENQSRVKVQWLLYGFTSAMSLVLAFFFVVQPIINRNIKGTEENMIAQEAKVRPKFQPEKDFTYRDSYVEATLYTTNFSEIYTDEVLYDKWFKYITDYMFQTWRVPEEKTIEVTAISKALVESIKAKATELDAEFAEAGIVKLKQTESEAIKRMAEALGTQVKFEAFKRKEREFFEPYVQNQ